MVYTCVVLSISTAGGLLRCFSSMTPVFGDLCLKMTCTCKHIDPRVARRVVYLPEKQIILVRKVACIMTPASCSDQAQQHTLFVAPHLSGPNMTVYGVPSVSSAGSKSAVAVRNFM